MFFTRLLFAIFGIYLLSHEVHAQKIPKAGVRVFGAEANYNFIFAHTSDVKQSAWSNPLRLELNYSIQTLGDKAWHKAYRFPRYGFSLNYLNFYQPQVLGRGYSALGFMEVINRRKGNLGFYFRIATGLTYLSQKFDIESNRDNLFYGQAINPSMQGTWNLSYRLSPKVQCLTGLSLTHFSNGSYSHPNKGINVIGWHAGIKYSPHDWLKARAEAEANKAEEEKPKSWTHAIRLGGAAKRVNLNGQLHGVQVLGFHSRYQYSFKGGVIGGIEMTRSEGIREDYQAREVRENQLYRAALTVGHETMVNRLSMLNYAGVYLYTGMPAPSFLYLSNGLKYRVTDHFCLTWLLRVHAGVADFIEYGLVYEW